MTTSDDHALSRWLAGLFRPVDIASLVCFRIAFGAIMVWEVYRYFDYGWIERYFVEPRLFFTYAGFHWLAPWPGDGMYWHFIGLALLAAGIAIGFCYRACAALFFLGFSYIHLLDKTNYLNHFYLISLLSFILIFIPAHRAMSIDAWLRPRLRSRTVPAWALRLLQFQIAVPYLFGAIAKMNADWLAGEPMRMWLADRTDMPIVGPWFAEEWVVYFMSYSGLLLDLLVVPALLWRPTRWLALAAVVLFHLMNSAMFSIGIFPWFMIVATLMFFPPDWPRRLLRLRRDEDEAPAVVSWTPLRRAGVAMLGIYVLLQIGLPFRHHLYPGDVNWREEGHRFSWHMKLRDKAAKVRFYATDVATGRTWLVDHTPLLSRRQRSKMPKRPDMILQFSHFLAEHIREQRGLEVQIRADTRVSLNGREWVQMIDPEADLTAERETLAPADWILPLNVPLASVPVD